VTIPAVKLYRELMDKHKPLPPRELLNKDYDPAPTNFVGLEGFLNARVLVAILEKMGPPFERKRLKAAAEAIADLDLGIGVPVSFRADRHQAIDQVYFTVVQNGRFEPLLDFKRWLR
jgi:branched-chain amino acid transport system substrate-binding protein